MFFSIGQVSEITGISITTLRRWEKGKKLTSCFRTKGNHRRYSLEKIETEILGKSCNKDKRKVYCYARVSTHDQKLDLKRQEKKLSNYCKKKKYNYEMISDLGSGLNMKKKGLKKLLNLILGRKISKLILNHKDRLLRFGTPLIFKMCDFFGTEVIILEEEKNKTFEQKLASDVIELMTVFTAKMYGKRSHKNKKYA